MSDAIVANLGIIAFIGLCVLIGSESDWRASRGIKALAVMWVCTWWSFIGWVVFAIVHFVSKYW